MVSKPIDICFRGGLRNAAHEGSNVKLRGHHEDVVQGAGLSCRHSTSSFFSHFLFLLLAFCAASSSLGVTGNGALAIHMPPISI